jgi:hypothetical protein
MALTSRHGKFGSLLDRAENSGLTRKDEMIPAQSLVPEAKDKRASLSAGARAIDKLLAGTDESADETPDNSTLAYVPTPETVGDRADRLFSKVTLSLKGVEEEQRARVEQLTLDAGDAASNIEKVLTRFKIAVPEQPSSPMMMTALSAVPMSSRKTATTSTIPSRSSIPP